MLKQFLGKKTFKHPLFTLVFICLAVFSLAACSNNSNASSGSSTGPTATATSTPPPVLFQVTSVDLGVDPNSIAGKVCGSSASFTYTATFHIPAGTTRGTIHVFYTGYNLPSSTSASSNLRPAESTAPFTVIRSWTPLPAH